MDQAEFEHTAKSIRAKALASALAYSISDEEAEDIAQDVMLKLWTLRNDICCADATRLAICIARNKAIDTLRKHNVRLCGEYVDMAGSTVPAPDTGVEEKENIDWLLKKIAELPPTEYQILRLRQVEHKTNDEISRLLGIEKTSVATLLSRARKRILQEFQKRKS